MVLVYISWYTDRLAWHMSVSGFQRSVCQFQKINFFYQKLHAVHYTVIWLLFVYVLMYTVCFAWYMSAYCIPGDALISFHLYFCVIFDVCSFELCYLYFWYILYLTCKSRNERDCDWSVHVWVQPSLHQFQAQL